MSILFLILWPAAHEAHTLLIYAEPSRLSFRPALISPRRSCLVPRYVIKSILPWCMNSDPSNLTHVTGTSVLSCKPGYSIPFVSYTWAALSDKTRQISDGASWPVSDGPGRYYEIEWDRNNFGSPDIAHTTIPSVIFSSPAFVTFPSCGICTDYSEREWR